MYKNTRIKLTISYVLTISIISIILSSILFTAINQITLESLKKEEKRIERNLIKSNQIQPTFNVKFSEETINEVRNKNIVNLIIFNLFIMTITGLIGYWYAGMVLNPIEENDRKQKEFISNAAHELKTPLTAAKTSLEVSLRDKNLNLENSISIIKLTIEDINQMDQVIKRLIKFQKTSELNESLELVRIDEIIENVIISFKPRLLDKKIIVNRNLEIKQINAYPTHIRELFVILIDNAIKFSKTYGEITINSAKVNNFIIFEVIDSGIGISKESIPFIFDRFYKSDTSRNKNNDSGTGLGLSIAKEIIEKHNGSIICNSEQDKSTKFTIKIPFK